ncbi:MAG: lysylphosphatidylglycerol synthase transmembrane domain-containing protein [Terriglobia bacterium]
MKKAGQYGISLGLTALIGYLVYRGVPDWHYAWHVMIQGNPLWLLSGLFFVILHMTLRALRWGILLSPVKHRIAFRNLFSLTLIKYVVNAVPPRAGEVAASILLARKEKISVASVIAASLLERILDMVTVIVIFGYYLIFYASRFMPNSNRGREIMTMIQKYSLKGMLVLGLLFGVLAFLLWKDRWLSQLPVRAQDLLRSFLGGFKGLQKGTVVLKSAILSLAIWISITLQLWSMLQAYVDVFPFAGALFLMSITVVGVAIPTPGGVGGFQFFMNLGLINFFAQYLATSDPVSQAAGISNGCYLASMVPVMLLGLYFLNREGLSFGRISKLDAEQKPRELEKLGSTPEL